MAYYFLQICVLHSVNHGPMAAQYNVSGTTYAPEGFVFESNGMQVNATIEQCFIYVIFSQTHTSIFILESCSLRGVLFC